MSQVTNFYGSGMMPQPNMYPGMVQWNQQQPMATIAMTNPLDNIQERLRTGLSRAIQITQEDIDQAICTHRDATRTYAESTHNPNDPDEVRCAICGATFDIVNEVTQEQIAALVKDITDALDTAKMLYVNVPDNLCREVFQIIAVLKQFDKIWAIASDQFQKFANPQGALGQANQYGSVFNNFNQLFGPNPFQQPMQPMMNPMMGQPMQPMMGQMPMMGQQMMQQPMGQPAVQQPMMDMNQQSIYPQTSVNMPPNMQAMAMTQGAPGVSNGFGFNQAPTNLNPGQQQPAIPSDIPKVTKTLQA